MTPDVQARSEHFVARARLMLQLGEQLISDEISALSELIKNSYDADSRTVSIEFKTNSDHKAVSIEVTDDGNGMNLEAMKKGWLEISSITKAREGETIPRLSPLLHRTMLGEKGLGRLSVHKLGDSTEIISRARPKTNEQIEKEVVLKIDWSKFTDSDKFLDEVYVNVSERNPTVFTDTKNEDNAHGTRIIISKLKSDWIPEIIERLRLQTRLMSSPLTGLRDFEIRLVLNDLSKSETTLLDFEDVTSKATYSISGDASKNGEFTFHYRFSHPSFQDLARTVDSKRNILDAERFKRGRQPLCGPFRFNVFSWELMGADKKLIFGSSQFFQEVVKPNTGIKLYRDGFRILPYGNHDNDWLSLDQRRTLRFAAHVSRSQVIGFVDIGSEKNPKLIDKSDREGLIDNESYRDFTNLILSCLSVFEVLRNHDREKIKKRQGRTRENQLAKHVKNFEMLQAKLDEPDFEKIPYEKREELRKIVIETRYDFETLLKETEQPLLVSAGIGLSVLMPTHEVRRGIQESIKLLQDISGANSWEEKKVFVDQVKDILYQLDRIVGGLINVQQRNVTKEEFQPESAIDLAETLYMNRLVRQSINYKKEIRAEFKIVGSSKQLAIAIENMLDNSSYWLQENKETDRKIKVIVDRFGGDPIIVVSDNGPGIQDDIETITLPFVSTKPNGTGLGLYIAERIAEFHSARLILLESDDIEGLLNGANIGIVFAQKQTKRKGAIKK